MLFSVIFTSLQATALETIILMCSYVLISKPFQSLDKCMLHRQISRWVHCQRQVAFFIFDSRLREGRFLASHEGKKTKKCFYVLNCGVTKANFTASGKTPVLNEVKNGTRNRNKIWNGLTEEVTK